VDTRPRVLAPCHLSDVDHPWRVKQRRADEHLRRFEDESADYLRTARLAYRHEADETTGVLRVTLHADAPPPAALGATIGDILHNLRSALDSVAWEACRQAGIPRSKQRQVLFPVTLDPDGWEDTADYRLPKVTGQSLAKFERHQPWY
jgi:hypothetical protein